MNFIAVAIAVVPSHVKDYFYFITYQFKSKHKVNGQLLINEI